MIARATTLAALLAAVAAGAVSAQVAVSGAGAVSFVEHRVSAGRGVEPSSGTVAGGAGALALGGRFELGVWSAAGSLTADTGQAEDREVAVVTARASVLPVPWLAIVAGATARSYKTPLARQRWTTARVGAEVRLAFVGGALRAIVRAELLPAASVSGLDNPNRAVAAAAGLEWRSGILLAGLEYALERYDFPLTGSLKRQEQLAELSARLGLRLGR